MLLNCLKLLQEFGSMCTEMCKVTMALLNVRHVEILFFTHRRQQTSQRTYCTCQ